MNKDAWTKDDYIYILLTDKSREKNWENEVRIDKDTQRPIENEGLRSRLSKIEGDCNVVDVDIKDGINSEQILQNFSIIFNRLKEGDDLYFDLTHGFRYLPMLILVLGKYAELLKNVNVKHISYGNFEMKDASTGVAPVIDLMALSSLQDWTQAASSYLKHGNANQLVGLNSQTLDPLLRNQETRSKNAVDLKSLTDNLLKVVEERRTCRGLDIVKSKSVKYLLAAISSIGDNDDIKPLTPLIQKIKDSLSVFDPHSNVMNVFRAGRWCYDNGLYQQAITLYYENMLTYICDKCNIKINNEGLRETVKYSLQDKKTGLKDKPDFRSFSKDKKLFDALINNPYVLTLAEVFNKYVDTRNDMEHSDMRANSYSYTTITQNIKSFMDEVDAAIQKAELIHIDSVATNEEVNLPHMLINLTNHPFAQWDDAQKQASRVYGDCIDLPFPCVEPQDGKDKIEALAKEYLNKIFQIGQGSIVTVHIMGEFNFCYSLINKLIENNIHCIASCTNRDVREVNGVKQSTFKFVRFRDY
jgi:CRISPR-associated Csx2 family protein